jgi:hypothetical protein
MWLAGLVTLAAALTAALAAFAAAAAFEHPHCRRLRSPSVLFGREFNTLTSLQHPALAPSCLDFRMMDEYVRTAAIWDDEAKALVHREAFHRSLHSWRSVGLCTAAAGASTATTAAAAHLALVPPRASTPELSLAVLQQAV